MSSSTGPGLTEQMPEPAWLEGPNGPLAFFAYPAAQPRLHLLISHGFAEHSGWWHHVAIALQARGISAYLFDHYHHGRSAGVPGDVADYSAFVAGLRTAVEQGAAPHLADGAALVLLGHSNGGLVSVLTLPQLPAGRVQGLVLCSPFFGFPRGTRWFGVTVATLLGLFSDQIRVRLPNRPWRLTACEAIWPAYAADPLRFRRITVRFFLAMRRALRLAAPLTALGGRPLLLLSAGQEVVVSRSAMGDWFARADSPDKSEHHYGDLRHELFNETRWEAVLEDVLRWLDARFAPAAAPARPAAD